MKILIDQINEFESQSKQTVATFNKIFTCKLTDLCDNLEVEISELADSDTTRFLSVGSLIVKHNFTPRTGDEKKGESRDEKDDV